MRHQSAFATVAHAITVAEGVFAPGRLGELTQHLLFELVDAVLEETGAVQRRLRDLLSRVGVYFLCAFGCTPTPGLRRGLQQTRGRPFGADGALALAEGPAGPAPPPGPRALEGAVRRTGRAVGPADHVRGALPAHPPPTAARKVHAARCTIECLMREDGLEGVIRGRRRHTILPEPTAPRPSDLVNRHFDANRPARTPAEARTQGPCPSGPGPSRVWPARPWGRGEPGEGREGARPDRRPATGLPAPADPPIRA